MSLVKEKNIESYLRKSIMKAGFQCFKLQFLGNNGGFDRLIIAPPNLTYFVETKSPGKPLRPQQEFMHKRFSLTGHNIYKIDSYDDVDLLVRQIKNDKIKALKSLHEATKINT